MRQSLHLIILLCAVWIVVACGSDKGERLQQLEMLEQMNRADSLMTDDSLALVLADYFDHHGTNNEKLRAYYILGRTYADQGEASKALEAYHAAVACDTTSEDCDYHTLCLAHIQMAEIFHRHYQPRTA